MCAAARHSERAPADDESVAVIGAGWAGCAAAMELAAAGCRVTLYEASRTPGGRARAVAFDGRHLDNGQHILLGAYRATLRLLRMAGVDTETALLRLPLQLRYPRGSGGMDFRAPRLPAPWHITVALLRAGGLDAADRMALARFSSTARWMGWQLHVDCTVAELLQRFDQTARLVRLMWRPLCIAALNTPPERASAQVFLNVLRDSLGARRSASDMLLPRIDLGTLFPTRAMDFVARHGGSVRLGTRIAAILPTEGKWLLRVADAGDTACHDALVVATHATQASALLRDLDGIPPPVFDHEPITTCYLQYAAGLRLDAPFFVLPDDPATQAWGQFVFDRGHLDPAQAGLLAVVVSASSEAIAGGNDALAAAIVAQLAATLRMPQLAEPRWTKVISEKRATFACTPGLQRPANATSFPNLVLAGDYTVSDYPATLESAVRSGVNAAQLLIGREESN